MIEHQVEPTEVGVGGGGGGGIGAGLGPYQQQLEMHFPAGTNEITGTVSVPNGVTFAIETVTADIGVTGGDQPFLFVETTVRGQTAQHTIVLKELPKMQDVYGATRRVQLYADGGSTINVLLTRFGSSGEPDIPKPELVTLSGRLIH